MTTTRNRRRALRGIVASDKMDKSITVLVERTYRHRKYGKFVRRHEKYLAHDEKGEANVGDFVEIVSTRPLSKRKRWRFSHVVSAAKFEDTTVPGVDAGRELEAGEE